MGTFFGLPEDALIRATYDGQVYLFEISYAAGIDLNDVVITNVVPIPAAAYLLASAIFGLIVVARRKAPLLKSA